MTEKNGGIPSFTGKRSCLKYPLNACKLDWEGKIFNFYVEPIAFKTKVLINVKSVLKNLVILSWKHNC